MSHRNDPTNRARISLGHALKALGDLRVRAAHGAAPAASVMDATAVAIAGIRNALIELDLVDARIVDLKADLSIADLQASGTR